MWSAHMQPRVRTWDRGSKQQRQRRTLEPGPSAPGRACGLPTATIGGGAAAPLPGHQVTSGPGAEAVSVVMLRKGA